MLINEDLLAEADRYFAGHPQGKNWQDTTETAARLGALQVAALEVGAFLRTVLVEPIAETIRFAVFEQALHLLTNPADGRVGSIISETIDGVGSRNYRQAASEETALLSPRARLLLESERGRQRIGRG